MIKPFGQKEILLAIVSMIFALPLMAAIGLLGQSLFLNMNPDHVNLRTDGWIKVIRFVTINNKVQVDIYGRPGKQKNTGEFVASRKGVLPFGIEALSPKYVCKDFWIAKETNCRNSIDNATFKGADNFFYVRMGRLYDQPRWLYEPTPSIVFSFHKSCQSDTFENYSLYYFFCDNIPVFKRIRKKPSDVPELLANKESMIVNQEIEKAFPINTSEKN